MTSKVENCDCKLVIRISIGLHSPLPSLLSSSQLLNNNDSNNVPSSSSMHLPSSSSSNTRTEIVRVIQRQQQRYNGVIQRRPNYYMNKNIDSMFSYTIGSHYDHHRLSSTSASASVSATPSSSSSLILHGDTTNVHCDNISGCTRTVMGDAHNVMNCYRYQSSEYYCTGKIQDDTNRSVIVSKTGLCVVFFDSIDTCNFDVTNDAPIIVMSNTDGANSSGLVVMNNTSDVILWNNDDGTQYKFSYEDISIIVICKTNYCNGNDTTVIFVCAWKYNQTYYRSRNNNWGNIDYNTSEVNNFSSKPMLLPSSLLSLSNTSTGIGGVIQRQHLHSLSSGNTSTGMSSLFPQVLIYIHVIAFLHNILDSFLVLTCQDISPQSLSHLFQANLYVRVIAILHNIFGSTLLVLVYLQPELLASLSCNPYSGSRGCVRRLLVRRLRQQGVVITTRFIHLGYYYYYYYRSIDSSGIQHDVSDKERSIIVNVNIGRSIARNAIQYNFVSDKVCYRIHDVAYDRIIGNSYNIHHGFEYYCRNKESSIFVTSIVTSNIHVYHEDDVPRNINTASDVNDTNRGVINATVSITTSNIHVYDKDSISIVTSDIDTSSNVNDTNSSVIASENILVFFFGIGLLLESLSLSLIGNNMAIVINNEIHGPSTSSSLVDFVLLDWNYMLSSHSDVHDIIVGLSLFLSSTRQNIGGIIVGKRDWHCYISSASLPSTNQNTSDIIVGINDKNINWHYCHELLPSIIYINDRNINRHYCYKFLSSLSSAISGIIVGNNNSLYSYGLSSSL